MCRIDDCFPKLHCEYPCLGASRTPNELAPATMSGDTKRFTTLDFASVDPNLISIFRERYRLEENVRVEPLMPRRSSESNKHHTSRGQ